MNTFLRKMNMIIFYLLILFYLISNVYNVDNSLFIDDTTIWGIIQSEGSQTKQLFKFLIPLTIFVFGVYRVVMNDKPGLYTQLIILLTIIIYIYSTLKFNYQDNGNVCYISQTSIIKKENKLQNIIYKFIYLLGFLYLLFSYNNYSYLFIYFILGIILQLITFSIQELYNIPYDQITEDNFITNIKCSIENQFGIYFYMIFTALFIYLNLFKKNNKT